MMENWLPIDGYPGYEVSDKGRVRSLERLDSRGRRRAERFLAPRSGRLGHLSVALYSVMTTFVGPRPAGLECCHWNDDPADNRLSNLRWDTRSANVSDQVRNGSHHMARRSHCPVGHSYTPDNTYVYPGGNRACRTCRRDQKSDLKARRARPILESV